MDKILQKISLDLKILMQDSIGILNEMEKGSEKTPSRKSIEPMTRLRDNIQNFSEVDERVLFIKDKLNDIFSKG
jgi:hypothetical protein